MAIYYIIISSIIVLPGMAAIWAARQDRKEYISFFEEMIKYLSE